MPTLEEPPERRERVTARTLGELSGLGRAGLVRDFVRGVGRLTVTANGMIFDLIGYDDRWDCFEARVSPAKETA